MTKRRNFIASIGTVGTITIAGCSGSGTTESSDSNDNDDPDISPEEAAERYYAAIREPDIERVNKLLHPDLNGYPAEEGDFETEKLTFVSTEELSLSEYVERDNSVDRALLD